LDRLADASLVAAGSNRGCAQVARFSPVATTGELMSGDERDVQDLVRRMEPVAVTGEEHAGTV
jgi:hypothetical protein